ncbi:hypothetical protein N9Z02_01130, partial [Akkermansiaceae bacterium]|nr:hypothetical protein [Akkermansiaceae bacterium]
MKGVKELRKQLQDKFPAAHRYSLEPEDSGFDPLSLSFSAGTLHELIAPEYCSGASLLISQLLENSKDLPLALIDGRNSFDPNSYGSVKCSRLFWIRCQEAMQAIQCTDLLLRDGNLPLVLLDLHLTSARELKRIPNTIWHRFRSEARTSGATLLALTPRACLPSPHSRV